MEAAIDLAAFPAGRGASPIVFTMPRHRARIDLDREGAETSG
ncbi:MAG: hypothetical protein ACXWUP_02895 [Allosphingosinicella sp.]